VSPHVSTPLFEIQLSYFLLNFFAYFFFRLQPFLRFWLADTPQRSLQSIVFTVSTLLEILALAGLGADPARAVLVSALLEILERPN
jgi:hypothetical protein